jgi:hypothetical protein
MDVYNHGNSHQALMDVQKQVTFAQGWSDGCIYHTHQSGQQVLLPPAEKAQSVTPLSSGPTGATQDLEGSSIPHSPL